MKKIICFVLVFSALFSGCGKNLENQEDNSVNSVSGETFFEEQNSKPENIPKEPEIENFDEILIYSDYNRIVYEELSEEQLAEWIGIIKPDEWKKDTAEKALLSENAVQLKYGMEATLYIYINEQGTESAVLKWGGSSLYSESYLLPEGVFENAKAFLEKIKREQYSVFDYPECNYDMSVGAFVQRKNDEYILRLGRFLDCLSWPVATGLDSFADYKGYSSGAELNSKQLFNCFMFIFEENWFSEASGRTDMAWRNETDEQYHIPLDDINSILGKYFSEYSFNYTEITVNYEYDEDIDGIIIPGGYGIGNQWYGDSKVSSVTDNGDGTITAVIEIYPFIANEEDGFDISEVPLIKNTLVLRPSEKGCICESFRIESIN